MIYNGSDTKSLQGTTIWGHLRRKSRTGSETPPFPESWQCVTHLKLLRAFLRLRSQVVDALIQEPLLDSLFGVESRPEKAQAATSIRDQAWHRYLEVASDRFQCWWLSMTPKNGATSQTSLSTCLKPGRLEALLQDTKAMVWTKKNLPPLDVLMILHSYMLNPRCFLEDCIRYNMLSLWKAGMPWLVLDEVLDTTINEYTDLPSARKLWAKATGSLWNLRQAKLQRTTSCPICKIPIKQEWNTLQPNESETSSNKVGPEADIYCPTCKTSFSKQQLQTHKFHKAVEMLQKHNIPLPGTILTLQGLAKSAATSTEMTGILQFNKILQGKQGDELLVLTQPKSMTNPSYPPISTIKTLLENNCINDANRQHLKPAIYRCMRQCTDNHSMFALDLAAAAARQGSFIQQMEQIDWLHSPALAYTMHELLTRYTTFFQIMAQNASQVAVPTLAVDLAWHTHQLSPPSYYAYSTTTTAGIFIDHDDRIDESVRTDSFGWTTAQYARLTHGKQYSECLCWVCATARDVTAGPSPPPPSLPLTEHDHVHLDQDSPFAHQVYSQIADAQYEKLQDDLELACRDAQRHCRPLPDKKAFLDAYVWPYPQAIPMIEV